MDPAVRQAVADLRRRQRRLQKEIDAVSSIIEGYEKLEALQRLEAAPTHEAEDATQEAEGVTDGSAPERVSAREAVRRIFATSDDAWRVDTLATAIARAEGWTMDARKPAQAIRTALGRLVQEGYLTRVAHGLYQRADAARATAPDASRRPQHEDDPAVTGSSSDAAIREEVSDDADRDHRDRHTPVVR